MTGIGVENMTVPILGEEELPGKKTNLIFSKDQQNNKELKPGTWIVSQKTGRCGYLTTMCEGIRMGKWYKS